MLDQETKRSIDAARQVLVGKIPDPKAQVEQITTALIYKFMDDMDRQNEELGGKAKFLVGDLKEFTWGRLISKELSGQERLDLYIRALLAFTQSKQIPELFRQIFKDAFLPYRDAETLNLFLKEINVFTYDHSENLGNAFEYLLSVLGSQGEAGQFRTPRHIIDFIVEVVAPKKSETILDPACGTAGFLISSYKHIRRNNSSNYKPKEYTPSFARTESKDVALVEIQGDGKYKGDKLNPDDRKRLSKHIIGYDISPDMVKLSLVNMYLHGFSTPQIFEYDTLTYEDRWDDNFDIILANPPFMSPKGGIRPHKRFQVQANRSEVLFVDYIAEHLTIKGRAGVIVPEGIIFQSANAYKELRKFLIEDNYLWAVVSLPAGVFKPYSGVKTSILFLDRERAKKNDEIIFVKVSNDGYDLGDQRRAIKKNDLPEAYRILSEWQKDRKEDISFANWVEKQAIIESADHNLTGDRYRAAIDYSNVEYPMVTLGDVCDILDSKRKPVKQADRKKGDYPYYGATGILDYVDEYLFDEKLVLIGEDGAKWNAGERTAFIATGKYWVNNHAHVLRPDRTRILDELLVALLNYMDLTPYITGVTVPKLNQQKLRAIEIPLPPLEVQNEIMAELDGYQRVIDGARQIVDNWKPTIKIDSNWEMVELGSACTTITDGSHYSPPTQDVGVPYITVKDIIGDRIDFTNCKHISEEEYQKLLKNGCQPQEDDILFSKDGTVGKVAHINYKKKFVVLSSLAIIRPNPRLLVPEYLKAVLQSDSFLREAIESKTGVAIRRIVLKTLKQIKIPLPTLDEQRNIVQQIAIEQKAVESAQVLVTIHELKIKNKIAEVWGE